MKVVFLIRALDLGGSQRQVAALATGLARRGHAVEVLTYYPGGAFEADLRNAGVATRALVARRSLLAPILLALRLVAHLRKAPPDALVAVLPSSTVLTAAVRPLLPKTMRLVWSIRAADMPLERYGWRARLVYRLQRRWLDRPDRIVANSERAARVLRDQPGPAPCREIALCANAIDTERFRPSDEPRSDDGPCVGFVGRMDPVKDPDLFLKIFARLAETRPDLRAAMLVPGDAAGREALQARADALGVSDRVEIRLSAEDMAGFYRALDLLLVTSVSESLPNVALEALACGVPVVSTDVGDVATAIGPFGRVVTVRTPEDLAGAAADVLADDALRVRTRAEAPAAIEARYGTDAIAARFEDLLG